MRGGVAPPDPGDLAERLRAQARAEGFAAIGIARPFSIFVNTFGTGTIPDRRLEQIVMELFDLTPGGMIKRFDLLNGKIYRKIPVTFFLDDYKWEKTDMVKKLRQAAK
ncbi:MAG: methionine adenosyltransferase domain-containing protein [Syntrophales bacterium]|nr:methionine adenosyltransferase domain-containing protein [Syntrophales bacterium]